MIPIGWNDGFSQNINSRITVRPMLSARRVEWAAYAKADPVAGLKSVLRAPWYFGPPQEKLTEEEITLVVNAVAGYSKQQEIDDFQTIEDNIVFYVTEEKFRNFSCEECLAFVITEEGFIHAGYNGVKTPRPKVNPVMCETSRGCARGHHTKQKGLTGLTRQVWVHYHECQATGHQPLCPIVMRNWALIRWILNGRNPLLNPYPGGAGSGRPAGCVISDPIPGLHETGADADGAQTADIQSGNAGGGIDPDAVYVPNSRDLHTGIR